MFGINIKRPNYFKTSIHRLPFRKFSTTSYDSDHLHSCEFFTLIRTSKYGEVKPSHIKSVVNLLESKDRGNISRVVTLIESFNLDHRKKADEILKTLFERYKKSHNNLPLDQTLPTFRIGI
jgi:hypothetical protein